MTNRRGKGVEVVTDFLVLDSKITVDGDCSREIRRWLLLSRKAMTIKNGQGFILVYSLVNQQSFQDIKPMRDQIIRVKRWEGRGRGQGASPVGAPQPSSSGIRTLSRVLWGGRSSSRNDYKSHKQPHILEAQPVPVSPSYSINSLPFHSQKDINLHKLYAHWN